MRKKKIEIKDIIISICFVVGTLSLGFLAGFLSGKAGGKTDLTFEQTLFKIVLDISIFIIVFMIQIIIHEGGHLIFGLISGYEFISFRIGSITIIKDEKKFKLKKFKIKGTGGQCLMMPITDNYEELPYVLYNLGGVLMNIIASVISGILLLTQSPNTYIEIILIAFVFTGLVCAIANGIPMKIGGVANDGYNILSISKDKFIKYCFYIQLKVNGLLSKGTRIKDMPIEWFYIKEGADLNNPLVTSLKIMEANYYHDKLYFTQAQKCYEDILENAPKIIKLYEYEINCELLFLEILNGNMKRVEELYTKNLRNYIKVTDCYISRKRLMYAYNLIVLKDEKKADMVLADFEKVKKTYPIKADIESEEEVINFIENNNEQ